MRFIFDKAMNQDFGELGLAARFLRDAEPMSALTCAHDILEHFERPGVRITTTGECMALGAALFVRAESGGMRNRYNGRGPGYMLSGDIAQLHTDAYTWGDIDDCPRTARLEDHVEAWIEEAVRLAWREILEVQPREDWPGDPEQWRRNVRGWLRTGYRRAARRYASGTGIDNWTFEALEKAIGDAGRHLEAGGVVIVRLRYNNPGNFTVEAFDQWEPGHPEYTREDWS